MADLLLQASHTLAGLDPSVVAAAADRGGLSQQQPQPKGERASTHPHWRCENQQAARSTAATDLAMTAKETQPHKKKRAQRNTKREHASSMPPLKRAKRSSRTKSLRDKCHSLQQHRDLLTCENETLRACIKTVKEMMGNAPNGKIQVPPDWSLSHLFVSAIPTLPNQGERACTATPPSQAAGGGVAECKPRSLPLSTANLTQFPQGKMPPSAKRSSSQVPVPLPPQGLSLHANEGGKGVTSTSYLPQGFALNATRKTFRLPEQPLAMNMPPPSPVSCTQAIASTTAAKQEPIPTQNYTATMSGSPSAGVDTNGVGMAMGLLQELVSQFTPPNKGGAPNAQSRSSGLPSLLPSDASYVAAQHTAASSYSNGTHGPSPAARCNDQATQAQVRSTGTSIAQQLHFSSWSSGSQVLPPEKNLAPVAAAAAVSAGGMPPVAPNGQVSQIDVSFALPPQQQAPVPQPGPRSPASDCSNSKGSNIKIADPTAARFLLELLKLAGAWTTEAANFGSSNNGRDIHGSLSPQTGEARSSSLADLLVNSARDSPRVLEKALEYLVSLSSGVSPSSLTCG